MRRFVLVSWLVALWVILWRDLSVVNIVSGLVVAVAVLGLFPVRALTVPHRPPRNHTVRPLALARFAVWFAYQLVVSNLIVAREVLTPRDHIRAGIVAVPIVGSSDLVTTVVANAITLTPGTLTVEVGDDTTVLYVHVLHLHDIDTVRRDIWTLQRLVVAAIGSADAIRAVAEAAPTVRSGAPDTASSNDRESPR